jgi:hypothetical protein
MAKKTAIATVNENKGFLKLADFNMNDAIAEELDGLDGGFERIKIPSAGSTVFEVPGEDPGEPEAAREFPAVILYHHPIYAYYQSKYTGGSNPPDCSSFDGITGAGNPGGLCGRCPYNHFGSGENGSKACKNRRRIYVLREGEIFPLLLSLPTGSLKEFSRYIKRLLSRGKKSNAVVTRFSLKKAVNSNGIAFSQAQFAVDRDLSSQEHALINKLCEQVKAYSHHIGYDAEPVDVELNVDMETGEIIEPLS